MEISDSVAPSRSRRIGRLRKIVILITIVQLFFSGLLIFVLPMNTGSGLILRHIPPSNTLGLSNIDDIEVTNNGMVYMASYEYVHRYYIYNDSFLEPLQFNSTPDSGRMGAIDIELLWSNWPSVVLFSGGYQGSAVRYFEIESSDIGNYTSDQFMTISTHFTHIASYQHGSKIFLGTDDLGLGIITQYNRTPYYLNTTHGLPYNQITNLKIRGNYLLIGTSVGFAIYDIQTEEIIMSWAENDIGGNLQVIAIDYYHAEQTVYVGNSDGLFIFRRNGDIFEVQRINSESVTPLPSDETKAIELDIERNRIYIGSYGGLSYLDLSDDTTLHPLVWGGELEYVSISEIRVPEYNSENMYLGTTLDYRSHLPGCLFEIPLDYDSQVNSAISLYRNFGFALMVSILGPWSYEYWINRRKNRFRTDQELIDLIAQGESRTVEFKETLLFDIKEDKESDYKIPFLCFKTIAGFLNTCGGILFIGVKDETREIVGLEPDYKLLKLKIKKKFDIEDQFRQHYNKLRTKFKLHEKFWPLVKAERRTLRGKNVFVIQVQQADAYVFLEKKDVFYIREDDATVPISPRKILEHWELRNQYCDE
ncbi:MAG: RNA-binding domain-containing protein [Candidatus Thorarchaeota archaeon]